MAANINLLPMSDIQENNLLKKRNERSSELCYHCEDQFEEKESKIVFDGKQWHQNCFACAQCLQPLEVDEVFMNDRRMYCKHDYKMLFAPVCRYCNDFVLQGRVIKALDKSWHADCFVCFSCKRLLSECPTFKKKDGQPYCPECYEKLKQVGYVCYKCKGSIPQDAYIKLDGEFYHPYHFQCKDCNNELDKNYREKDKDFYCLRCFDKFGVAICAACRRPVEGRIVYALGKPYHVEHLVCSFCSKPFLGMHYFVHEGAYYCETHYQLVALKTCAYCQRNVGLDSVDFLEKSYCVEHFYCFACDVLLDRNSKIYKVDRKPICKMCLQKLPSHLRKRLTAIHKLEPKKPENHVMK